MKRKNNLFELICSQQNLELADMKARKKKHHYKEVIEFDKDRDNNLLELQKILCNQTYKTSKYEIFKIYEPKERIIYELPYYPDRIVHHAIMNVMEDFWTNKISNTSYSCIKGRGVHGAYKYLKKCLNSSEYRCCLKGDIRKFFPNVNHRILKRVVSKYSKDFSTLLCL